MPFYPSPCRRDTREPEAEINLRWHVSASRKKVSRYLHARARSLGKFHAMTHFTTDDRSLCRFLLIKNVDTSWKFTSHFDSPRSRWLDYVHCDPAWQYNTPEVDCNCQFLWDSIILELRLLKCFWLLEKTHQLWVDLCRKSVSSD